MNFTIPCDCPPAHSPGVAPTACACLEGFAHFFAARVTYVFDGSIASTDQLSQYVLGLNTYRLIGHNGLLESL